MKKIIFIFLFLTILTNQAETTEVIFINNSGIDVIFKCDDPKDISTSHRVTINKTIKYENDKASTIDCEKNKDIVITVGGSKCNIKASEKNTPLTLTKVNSDQGDKYVLKRSGNLPDITCCPTGQDKC